MAEECHSETRRVEDSLTKIDGVDYAGQTKRYEAEEDVEKELQATAS